MAIEKDAPIYPENIKFVGSHTEGEGEGRPRILFLGNSVTFHPPKAVIGWDGNWGMAASCPEKDYVHLTMAKIREKHPNASWRLCWLVDWERAFWRGEEMLADYAGVSNDWQPDVIFSVILGANTTDETLRGRDYAKVYADMIRYFDKNGAAERIITTNFWDSPEKNAAICAAAADVGATLVEMSDLGSIDAMQALGLFEHPGVAAHPGDQGMQEISSRLLKAVKTI